MAEKRRFLDVWIVESNTVYREVPYTVVVDWVQQGRLLEDDNLRWSGQKDWFRLGGAPAFAAYLPRSEPFQANDQAEALEPVEVDFRWKHRADDDEDDVDMIPLIDVSLVLLIFFMMIGTSLAAGFTVNTPEAEHGWVTSDPEMYWVGIDFERARDSKIKDPHQFVFALGKADVEEASWTATDGTAPREGALTEKDALARIIQALQEKQGQLEVTIKADGEVPSGLVRDLTRALESIRVKVSNKYIGVSEKKGSE